MMMSGLSSWCCLFRGFFLDVFCWDGSSSGASRRVLDRRERSRQPVGSERWSSIRRRVRINADTEGGGDGK